MRNTALPKRAWIDDDRGVNRNLLIDQVVRQTMVLIAHLATQGGARAPLSDVAERVFRGLVDELAAQRLSHKVIADMFGLALRTYYDRVKRLTESNTVRGRSLWEALFDFIRARATATRSVILERFRHDDEAVVKAVLNDLVESGLIAKSGRGPRAVYLVVPSPDVAASDTLAALVQVALFHRGTATAVVIAEALGIELAAAESALDKLVSDGRAERADGGYSSDRCLIPADDPAGFEGAVMDHIQAVIGALCHRLRRRGRKSELDAAIGGSTYTFDVAPDNPTLARVTGLLSRYRAELSALRDEADAFEAANATQAGRSRPTRFIFYCGQNALSEQLASVARAPLAAEDPA